MISSRKKKTHTQDLMLSKKVLVLLKDPNSQTKTRPPEGSCKSLKRDMGIRTQ